jgi:hypothetical protein
MLLNTVSKKVSACTVYKGDAMFAKWKTQTKPYSPSTYFFSLHYFCINRWPNPLITKAHEMSRSPITRKQRGRVLRKQRRWRPPSKTTTWLLVIFCLLVPLLFCALPVKAHETQEGPGATEGHGSARHLAMFLCCARLRQKENIADTFSHRYRPRDHLFLYRRVPQRKSGDHTKPAWRQDNTVIYWVYA